MECDIRQPAGWNFVRSEVPAITTVSLSGGTAGVSYSQAISFTGATVPVVWSVISGSLPAGISLDRKFLLLRRYLLAEVLRECLIVRPSALPERLYRLYGV